MLRRNIRTKGRRKQDQACRENLMDLPRKETDLGVVVLPISIGNIQFAIALFNIDASVNIISLSVVQRIEYLQVKSYAG